MLQAARLTIEKTLNPMLSAIKKKDWEKADDIWGDSDCYFCRDYDEICSKCPVSTFWNNTSCWGTVWYGDFRSAIHNEDDIAILYIGDIIEELKQLNEI